MVLRARALTELAAAVVVVAVVMAGCSDRQDDPRAGLLAVPSTSSGTPTTRDPSLPPPPTPAQIRAKFDAAIAAKDFCAVVAALDAVTETYQIVAESVKAAKALAPSSLTESWSAVIEATGLAAVEAKRAGGEIDDPSIQAQFATSTFDDAYRDTIAWTTDNCP